MGFLANYNLMVFSSMNKSVIRLYIGLGLFFLVLFVLFLSKKYLTDC